MLIDIQVNDVLWRTVDVLYHFLNFVQKNFIQNTNYIKCRPLNSDGIRASRNYLLLQSWDSVNDYSNIKEDYDYSYKSISDCINEFLPNERVSKRKEYLAVWLTPALKDSC